MHFAKANRCVTCVLMGLNGLLVWYLRLCCVNVLVGSLRGLLWVIRSLQWGLKGCVGRGFTITGSNFNR